MVELGLLMAAWCIYDIFDEMSQKSDNWCRTRAFMVGGVWRVCWKEVYRLGEWKVFLVMMRHGTASWYTVVASTHKIYLMCVFPWTIMFTCFFQTPWIIDVQTCHVSWASVQSLVVSSKGRQFFPVAAVYHTTAGDTPLMRFRPAGSATRGGSEGTGGELHEGHEDVIGWPKSNGFFFATKSSCRN